MIKTNKRTGQTVDIPDNTPPEQMAQAISAALSKQPTQNSVPAPQEKNFSEQLKANPIPRFLAGAGRTIAETGPVPLARVLAKMGIPGASKVIEGYNKSNEGVDLGDAGKYGGIAADVGLGVATGGESLVPAALAMAAQHQLQNYSRTGEISPEDAAFDAGTGVVLGGIGGKLGPLFKGAGKNILRNVVQPTAKLAKTSLEPALQSSSGILKYFEGLPGLQKRVTAKVSNAGKNKVAELEAAGFQGRRGKAMIDAVKDIESRTPEMGPKLGLNAPEREDAIAGVNRWAEPTSKLSPKESISLLSKVYDDAYKSGKDINLAGRERGAREFGSKLRGQMDEHMASQPLDALGRYEAASKDFREFEPIRQAVNHRVEIPSSKRLALGRIPVAGGLIEAGVYRPGTANLLYDLGRTADNSKARTAGRYGLDLARSAYFGPGGGNR